jgi:hypothetical protein
MHKTSLTAVCLELCYYAASILYLKVCKLMLGCLCSDGPELMSLKMELIFIVLILACLLSFALPDPQGMICCARLTFISFAFNSFRDHITMLTMF